MKKTFNYKDKTYEVTFTDAIADIEDYDDCFMLAIKTDGKIRWLRVDYYRIVDYFKTEEPENDSKLYHIRNIELVD